MKASVANRKIKVIVNPVSGTHSKRGVSGLIERSLRDMGFDSDICFTTCRGDATRLAREAVAEGCYGVLAVGGDGTVNETAAALCGSQTALGIIPLGSGNGLARHVGIPMDIKAALRIIGRDAVRACDYAKANGRPFFCTCGFGFDAAVTHRFSRKRRRGLMTYLQSTFEEFTNYKCLKYRITVDDYEAFEQDAFVVACCNASQYGNNAYIAPSASINDGLLDVTIIHAGNTLSTALVGVDMLTGMIEKNMLIHTFRTNNMQIIRERRGPSHVDGEPMELDEHLDIECVHSGLKVFTPTVVHPFRPILTPVSSMLSDFRIAVSKLFQKPAF